MVEALRPGDPDPDQIGPFRVCAWLGSGGFGDVYAALRKDATGEPVAVKLARREVVHSSEFPARFRREIAAISRVKSEFVPKLVESHAADTRAWLATELIPGLPLNEVVDTYRPLPEEAVWRLGAGIAEALVAIHAAGLTHRDLKPQNVLLGSDGPWVIDFNLAHLVDGGHEFSSRVWTRGHYGFSAPEEATGNLSTLGEPADIYMLGATLVYAATGHAPRNARTREELASAKPNLNGLHESLRSLVEGCLASEPDRLSLANVRLELAAHAGGPAPGRTGFADVLPGELVSLLDARREELARVLGVRGPARLGWVPARPTGPGDQSGDARPRPVAEPPHRPAANPAWKPAVAPAHRRWTSKLGSWVCGPVAVQGHRLVVACLDGTVEVLRAGDGEVPAAWHHPVNVGTALHAGLLVLTRSGGDGTAYAGGADGRLHAIDLASGRDRVIVAAGHALLGTPVAEGKRVYALSADGRVHSVSLDTGEPKVLFQLDDTATEALSAAAGTIFAADTGGVVYAIGATDGRERWRLPTSGLVLSAPLPVGEWVYVCGTDGMLREVGIKHGRERPPAKIGAPVHTTPAHDGGRLYVGASDGTVRAYDIARRHGRDSLDLLWEHPVGDEIAGLAAVGGRVYVAAGHRLLEIDGATNVAGKVFDMNFLIGAPPVVSRGHCYVVGLGGIVTCLRLS
jgi:outer membrane protein assembly factor BamB